MYIQGTCDLRQGTREGQLPFVSGRPCNTILRREQYNDKAKTVSYLGIVDISMFFSFGPARCDETTSSSSTVLGLSARGKNGSRKGGGDSKCNLSCPLVSSVVGLSTPINNHKTAYYMSEVRYTCTV